VICNDYGAGGGEALLGERSPQRSEGKLSEPLPPQLPLAFLSFLCLFYLSIISARRGAAAKPATAMR